MALVLITPPTTEPLTNTEAGEHLRVEDEDVLTGYVDRLIAAARRHVEMVTGRALITQTWESVLDAFPRPCPRTSPSWPAIVLDKGALQSVTSVTYVDAAGATQTLAPDKYLVDKDSTPGRVLPAYGETWPETREQPNAVRVRFVAGYANAAAVPEDVKAAMLLIIGQLYEKREVDIIGAVVSPITFALEALLAPYRLHVGI